MMNEKMTTITVNGVPVPVTSLSEKSQKAIASLNRYYDEYVEAAHVFEKAGIVVTVKKAEVENIIKEELKLLNKAQEPEAD